MIVGQIFDLNHLIHLPVILKITLFVAAAGRQPGTATRLTTAMVTLLSPNLEHSFRTSIN